MITLGIGEIKISLDDFLQLRPGMKIDYGIPESYEGCIQLDGKNFAKVKITHNSGSISLEVKELCYLTERSALAES